MNLEIFWYLILIVAMIAYTVLDGFDIGVGSLHLFVKKDQERRIFLNAIGPVWDGNEVWLVIVVGALFAGFPDVYATLTSSFYLFVMGFLAALIFRVCAIEFRSKKETARWRKTWDVVFCFSSVAIAFGIGMILGKLIEGIPLDQERNFVGTISDFFTPYSLLIGVMAISLFAMHGATYLVMKTEKSLQKKLKIWTNRCLILFLSLYLVSTFATFYYFPYMIGRITGAHWFFVIPVIIAVIINIPYQMQKNNDGIAFLSSCVLIALLLSLFAIGTYPVLIRSTLAPESNSLTVFNSASSFLTLKVLAIIVAIGVPLVLAYGAYVYHLFRGKVKLDKHSY